MYHDSRRGSVKAQFVSRPRGQTTTIRDNNDMESRSCKVDHLSRWLVHVREIIATRSPAHTLTWIEQISITSNRERSQLVWANILLNTGWRLCPLERKMFGLTLFLHRTVILPCLELCLKHSVEDVFARAQNMISPFLRVNTTLFGRKTQIWRVTPYPRAL